MNFLIKFFKDNIPGFLLISFVVLIASFVSVYIKIGSIACAIILGILVKFLFPIHNSLASGINFSEKHLLSLAIILMGANLDASVLKIIEWNVFLLIVLLILVAIISSLVLGRLFKLSPLLSLLLGIGNGICGSSAIAGAAPIIKAKDEDVGLSISTINILGAIGIFFVPFCLDLFFSGAIENAGIVIGSTIQAVGQVTAAGFIMGDDIGEIATLIKMVRILMLGPILVLLTLIYMKKTEKTSLSIFPIPFFIVGFIIFIFLFNYNFIPAFLLPIIKVICKYLLMFAMTAIGLKISLKSIIRKGSKVFAVGMITFCIQIILAIVFLS